MMFYIYNRMLLIDYIFTVSTVEEPRPITPVGPKLS